MSEPKTQQEPTMEEILASIRRIISEDGEEGAQPAAAGAPKPAPPPAAVAKPEPPPPPPPAAPAAPAADDVLELTQMVKDDGSVVDLTAAEPEPPPPPPPPPPAPAAVAPPPPRVEAPVEAGQLISSPTASAAASSFSNLASAVSDARGLPIGYGARTIEELVKELLRPMLRDWLDANLPGLVQRIVEREVAKLAGRAEDDGRH